MTTKKEVSSITKFISEANGLIQMALLVTSLFILGFSTDLNPPFNIILLIGGELLVGIACVLSASISMQQGIIKQNQESQLKGFIQTQDDAQVLSIPPMRALLIRNTLVLILFALGTVVLWSGLFGITFGVRQYFESERTQILISASVFMSGVMTAVYGTFISLTMGTWIVDRYLYRHEAIWQAVYKNDEAKKNDKATILGFVKSFAKVLGVGILFGGLFTLLMFLRVWLKSDNFNLDLPIYGYVLCIGAMLVLPFAGLWWLYSSLTGRDTKWELKVKEAIIQEHGEDSAELREFTKAVEQRENSLERQVSNRSMKLVIIGMVMLGVTVIGTQILLIAFGVSSENAERLQTAILCIFGIGLFWMISSSGFLTRGIQHPEEYAKIDEAIQQGNYTAAKEYADIIKEKKPPVEANIAIAMTYGVAGELDVAEKACRDAIQILLATDEERRMKPMIAHYLWLLGAVLIAAQRYSEAEEALHQALEYDDKAIPVYGNLAEAALHLGYNGEIVLEYLDKAFALNERQPEAQREKLFASRMLKAWALSRLGQRKEAFELMQVVFSEAPQDFVPLMGELHYLSGRIAMEQGKTVTAQSAFHKSLQIDANGMYSHITKSMLEQL